MGDARRIDLAALAVGKGARIIEGLSCQRNHAQPALHFALLHVCRAALRMRGESKQTTQGNDIPEKIRWSWHVFLFVSLHGKRRRTRKLRTAIRGWRETLMRDEVLINT